MLIRKYYINEIISLIILASYYVVFSKNNDGGGYINSKFWLGVSENNVKALIPLQLAAAVGALIWVKTLRDQPAQKGLLSYKLWGESVFEIIILLFLVGSVIWPWSLLQPKLIESPTMTKTLICCTGLFIAAIAGIMAQAGSFEADIPWYALISITVFNLTVVLNDGVGWSARLIHQTLYP